MIIIKTDKQYQAYQRVEGTVFAAFSNSREQAATECLKLVVDQARKS